MTKWRSYLRNRISLAGLALTLVATVIGLPLMFFDILTDKANPYAGIFIYGVLPGLAAFGVFVALFGVYFERKRRLRSPGEPVPPFPIIDLNDPHQRLILVGSFSGVLVILVLLAITSYRAYNFTDSIQFCGEVCHGVMKPEYTAYKDSPHARVACVACHVGPGAGWYVHSKISGAYQIYSVIFHKYPRPIPTPVHDLRPARATCEECHWPAKFFGAQQKTFSHYLADEKNSPWQIQALIKIGGGDSKAGASGGGIHWHMYLNNDIYYVASDAQRETIPYVKSVGKDGQVTEYMSTDNPLTPEQLAKSVPRKVDCVDCHNRPSHIYWAPDRSMDLAFETGRLDPSLPYLKREGMRLLAGDYKTETEGLSAIAQGLPEFYAKNYPALLKEKAPLVGEAVRSIQAIFSATIFPEMKTDWRAHPNHIGHLNSDGCFRCHDGLHKSADGKVITNDCGACHTFLAQGKPEDLAKMKLQAQPFKHPVDVGVDVTTMKCDTCHTGTTGL
jgi:hypothetical protein